MIVTLALDIETNVKLFMALLLYGLSLLALSILMDGKNAIVVPFWKGEGNTRKAYKLIENKKIIHIIKGQEASQL